MAKNTIIITEEGLGINSSETDSFYIPNESIVNSPADPIEEGPPFVIQLYVWQRKENNNYHISTFYEMGEFIEAMSSLIKAIRDGDELWDVRDYISNR